MKKVILMSLTIAMTGLFISCGPGKEEMEAEAKRVADSIATVEAEAKKVADEQLAAAETQRVVDSTAAAEAVAKAAADSLEAAKNKKGGKKK